MKILLSQTGADLGPIGAPDKTGGLGPFGDAWKTITKPDVAGQKLSGIMSNILGIITVSAGLWFIIQLLIGAFKWLTSGGDKQTLEQARDHLTQAFIGLAIIVAAYILAGLFGAILGLDILNPQKIIPLLGP